MSQSQPIVFSMPITHESLEAAAMKHLREPWERARGSGQRAAGLVLVGTYDETTPDVAPILAVMTLEKAAKHLAMISSRGLHHAMLEIEEKSFTAKFSESERFGITALVTAIACADGGSSVQYAEGISSSSFQGSA